MMSASPADRTPGRTPTGGQPQVMRRPKPADPMVRPKPRNKPRPQGTPSINGVGGAHSNGRSVPGQGQTQVMPQHPGRPMVVPPRRPSPSIPNLPDDSEIKTSGFSSPALAPYTDFPLVTTKRAFMEGLRHHVIRFASKKSVDPQNTEEFTRPVRLHRRDPRAPPGGGGGNKDDDMAMDGVDSKDGLIDSKERERQELLKAQRDAAREAEMAQVAPSANTGGQKKLNAFKKKTQQIYRNDKTDEQKAESKLRYEETLPWFMEDFDNKQTWVGSYEAALSETHMILVHGQDGTFRMLPLERWYKFTSKNQFKSLTIEEAEARLDKKVTQPRWFQRGELDKIAKESEKQNSRQAKKLWLGKIDGDQASRSTITKNEHVDADDLDFIEDRFADDEENGMFEVENEETKEAEERIQRDQKQANIFDLKDEKEYDKQDRLEKKEKETEKKLGKGVKKALMKREKNFIYDSDTEDNPYSETSESEDTETELRKEEGRKKEEERKKDEEEKKTASDREKSKTSKNSSGNTTPVHKSSRPSNLSKKPSTNNLKRPGSPNLSEASGNESSRKKHKKQHATSSQPQSSTLKPPSRPMSPANAPPSSAPEASRSANLSQRKSPAIHTSGARPEKRARPDAGSGSDVGSGGEMSDGKRKKLKLKLSQPSSKGVTPQGSRAGSPERGGDGGTKSNAGSQASGPDTFVYPTGAELQAHVPPEGIRLSELMKFFPGAARPERKGKFADVMKAHLRYDRATKLLTPKNK